MKKIKKWKVADMLWDLYGEACVCSMDHGTSCECRAGDQAAAYLESLLGKKWHEKMCKRQGL